MDFDEESVCTQTFRYSDGDISTQLTLEAARGVNNVKVQVGQLHTKETTFPIYKGINIIGRDKSRCDIVLPSLTVSNRHAEIDADSKSDVFICDIGSSNGTLLNNTRLKKNKMYQILDQNVIQIGEISAKYVFLNESKDTSCTEIQKPSRLNVDYEQQHNVSRASTPSSSECLASKEIEDSFDDIFNVATQKSMCINEHPVKSQNKSDIIAEESIFDMETQGVACLVGRKQSDSVVEDSIFDAETQKSALVSIVEESIFDAEMHKSSQVCIDKLSVHSESLVESSIFDAATQKFDKQSTKTEKGIDGIAHSTPLREDHKFTVPRKPPLKSLNISAIELSKIMVNQTNTHNSQVERNLDHSEDIFDAEIQQLKQVNDQDMSIYDAPTQCLSSTAESLNYNDSDTDEEAAFDSTSSKRSVITKSLLKWDDNDLSIFDAPTQNIEKSQRFITDESIINGSDNVTNAYHAEAQMLKKKSSGTTINDCNESSNESICLLDTESARQFLSKSAADISNKSDTCVTRKIKLSKNSKEPSSGCDIYEAVTQKLNNFAQDNEDCETDEELTFLGRVRANNYKELNIMDNDIFDAPTQEMTVTTKPKIDAIIFDAPTQKMGETSFDNDDIYDAPTQMIVPTPAQVVNIFDAPTQKMKAELTTVIESSDSDTDQEGIFEPNNLAKKILIDTNELGNNKPTSQVENIFDAVTQKIVVQQGDDSETDEEGEFRVASRKQTTIERNEYEQDDDIFDAPTQLMSWRKIDFKYKQYDSDSDIDMVPTQKLVGKQQIDNNMMDKSMSEEDAELSDQQPPDNEQQQQQHLPATQKMILDDSSNDVFQVNEKKNEPVNMAPSPIEQDDSDSDIDMVATQKLEINHNKTNNLTILLDTCDDEPLSSAGPIEEKLLKMVGESSNLKGSSPMLTQQLVDILEPSQQQQSTELESSPIVRSRMRLKRTPKKCATSPSIEDNLKGLLGEPQQTEDVSNNVSSQMLTQQIVDVLESQPSNSLVAAQENKTSEWKNASQAPKTKQSRRCAPIQINPEGYINLRPRRKRNITETSDGPTEAQQPTRPKRSRKTEQASATGESSGTLRLSLTEKNDVWESIPTKSPDTNSTKAAPPKVASTRPRGRPRGSTKKKPDQVRK